MGTDLTRPASVRPLTWKEQLEAAEWIPKFAGDLFCEPPLLPGESDMEYLAVVGRLAESVGPEEYLDWLLLRDAADATWEAQRYRRLKANALAAISVAALQEYIHGVLRQQEAKKPDRVGPLDPDHLLRRQAEQVAWKWYAKDDDAARRVEKIMAEEQAELKVLTAREFLDHSDKFERLDRLIEAHDQRREAALKEILRRRSAGRQLKRSEPETIEHAA